MAIITITGDNNANVLTGTSATDQYNINGLGGNDTMHGNALNDTLDGGAVLPGFELALKDFFGELDRQG